MGTFLRTWAVVALVSVFGGCRNDPPSAPNHNGVGPSNPNEKAVSKEPGVDSTVPPHMKKRHANDIRDYRERRKVLGRPW